MALQLLLYIATYTYVLKYLPRCRCVADRYPIKSLCTGLSQALEQLALVGVGFEGEGAALSKCMATSISFCMLSQQILYSMCHMALYVPPQHHLPLSVHATD